MTNIRHYGDWFVGGEFVQRTTVHGSGVIDIVVDPITREVTQVWFRCLNLPFNVSNAEPRTTPINPIDIKITAIEYFVA